jgi:glycosyltransferase involved in cell wall biosynthesis
MINEFDIADIVEVCSPISYVDALNEMLDADVLLLLQAANCNDQIPAKAYEYIRVRKPILALTARQGETANLIEESGAGMVAPLDNSELIAEAIEEMLLEKNRKKMCLLDNVDRYSRRNGAITLIKLLESFLKI